MCGRGSLSDQLTVERSGTTASQSVSPPPVAQRGGLTAETPIPGRRRAERPAEPRRRRRRQSEEKLGPQTCDRCRGGYSHLSSGEKKKGKSSTSLRDGTGARRSKAWSSEAALLLRTRSCLAVYFPQGLFSFLIPLLLPPSFSFFFLTSTDFRASLTDRKRAWFRVRRGPRESEN